MTLDGAHRSDNRTVRPGAIGVRSPLAQDHSMPGSEFYILVPIAEIAEDE